MQPETLKALSHLSQHNPKPFGYTIVEIRREIRKQRQAAMVDDNPSKAAVMGALVSLRSQKKVGVGGRTRVARIVFRMDGSQSRSISRHKVNQYRLVGDPPPMY